MDTPITRKEQYLAKIAGESVPLPAPETREEQYLAKIAGEDVTIPEKPETREEQYLAAIVENGGGGGGGGISVPDDYLLLDTLSVNYGEVDTGIYADNTIKMWGQFHSSGYNSRYLFSDTNHNSYQGRIFLTTNQSGTATVRFGSPSGSNVSFSGMWNFGNYDSVFYLDNQGAMIDGVSLAYTTAPPEAFVNITDTIKLFVSRVGAGSESGFGGWLRRLCIEQGGTLVRDYVPVKRKSDDVAGLYDLVNGVFVTKTDGAAGSLSAGAPALSNYV